MGKINVINPGFFTTVQDEGRFGYRSLGIADSGAIDDFAYKISNYLVGNELPLASLEMIMDKAKIRFLSEELISICGGGSIPLLNKKQVPLWTALKVNSGDVLSFQYNENGMTSYLSFAGGLNIKKVLSSYSTNIKGNFGGFNGRKLKTGDNIEVSTNKLNMYKYIGNKLLKEYVPFYKDYSELKVILGPQDDYFSKKEINKFLSQLYDISPLVDRVGFRLEGRALVHDKDSNIISDANNKGAIQVPGDGMPIILMNDCGTTGGYPKIATIISSELKKVAQLKPGDNLSFKCISLEESYKIYLKYSKTMEYLRYILLNKKINNNSYNVNINSKNYVVSIEEE